ncbi:hypothetical protein SAICODRAFT_31790 [Saitoella complicata NRRL Y-17804]|uniref:uncharacterized protein n=1 Tax=Saitoella complicata (strain BCRC 22490 / CBS 7301 / JCM 7358 / NBRC 10748 / NRRL Y-17804) TaxID=698492 RepID=UPI00086802A2|nr:uncharacterized protein SAICODRAFT_31790 [Saitoella complicata NRRL Y-17804]ODQ50780.1 hypothetical protein SAICODRAFT_31790 [Saitoella complicata NRRL Y-17804]
MPTPAMGTVFKAIDAEKGSWLKPAQFELSLGGWNGMDAYDISYIDGDGEIASASMKPVGGSGNCDDLVCKDADNCKYAYYLPDDVQTYTCTGPDSFEVNLCIA